VPFRGGRFGWGLLRLALRLGRLLHRLFLVRVLLPLGLLLLHLLLRRGRGLPYLGLGLAFLCLALLGRRSLRLLLLRSALAFRRCLLGTFLLLGWSFGSRLRQRQWVVAQRTEVGDHVLALLDPAETRKSHLRAGYCGA